MRQISDAALLMLSNNIGIEPLNILTIYWTPSFTGYYCDKDFPDLNLQGKIIQLSNLENIVNISGNNSSQSISVILDDIDGSIKAIFDLNDVHKRPVTVYQWFEGMAVTDSFVVFSGQINSPIVWKEGDRTVSFEIVSQLEDMEVGFSPEEGLFSSIPDELIGKAWPLPFGTCLQVPALRLDPIPTAFSMDTNGIEDSSLQKQTSKLAAQIVELKQWAIWMFYAAIEAYLTAETPPNGDVFNHDQHFDQLGDQYTDKGNEYLAQADQAGQDIVNLVQTLQSQKKYHRNSMRLNNGECLPQGQQLQTKLNGIRHIGSMSGNVLIVDSVQLPTQQGTTDATVQTVKVENTIKEGGSQDIIQPGNFTWIPAGVSIQIDTDIPIRMIVAMIPVTVINVWAWRNYDDGKALSQVPGEYYTIAYESFGPVTATVLILTKALTHYGLGWEDEIFCDVVSPIGPNSVDIISWLISTYSTLAIDATSFELVRSQVNPFPANFCLFDRPNIVKLLSDIAFQSRCAIWIDNGIFHMQYLVAQPQPIAVISQSDIVSNTLEIGHTPTEQIVTKLVASYKTNYFDNKDYKIIIRNNIIKYGVHAIEQDYNWFIYNTPNLVDLAATFWSIRKSNTWKILRFRTPMHMLKVETFDAITIVFTEDWASYGSIVGIVQSMKFDSEKLELEFEVWIPVRLGEMTQYNFAWPVDSDVLVYRGDGFITTPASGTLTPTNGVCRRGGYTIQKGSRNSITNGAANPGSNNIDGSVFLQPIIQGLDPTTRPAFNYNYRNYNVAPFSTADANQPGTFPAKLVSFNAQTNYWTVWLYLKSFANQPINTVAVNADSSQIPNAGDWVMVSVVTWQETTDSGGQGQRPVTKSEKYFLPAKGKPGMYPGQVTGGGPGNLYSVDVYFNGLDKPATNIANVKQLQIDPTDTLSAGAWCLVGETSQPDPNDQAGIKRIPKYFIQVPIWL